MNLITRRYSLANFSRPRRCALLATSALSLIVLLATSMIAPALAGATGSTASSISIVASPTSNQTFGQSVTITATVTSGATGTVNFEYSTDGSTYSSITGCNAQSLASPPATCVTTAIPLGTIDLEAMYSGDGTYAPSTSSAYNFHVNPGSTASSVAITSTSVTSPQKQGTSIMFTATVTASATATVNFESSTNGSTYSSITGCSAQTISTTTSTCTTNALPLGTMDVEAVFSGDGTYAASTSAAYPYRITTGTTTSSVAITGASPSSPVPVNTSVTLTATVNAGATGTVTFEYSKDGVNFYTISACTNDTVSGTTATCTTTLVPVGTVYLVAVYSGDGTYASSTSTAYAYHVISGSSASAVAITGVVPAGTAIVNGSVTITATVNAGATGTVEFESSLNGVSYTGITGCISDGISANVATCTSTSIPLGTTDLEAVYSGDATYATSTSSPLAYTVRYASSVSVSAIVPATTTTYGTSETITATITTGATGTVEFETSTNDATFTSISGCTVSPVNVTSHSATCATTALPTGTIYIEAIYSGDSNYAPLTSPAVLYVVTQATQGALSVSSITGVYGKALSLTTSGGSGTGAVTYGVVNGTASGCVVSGSTLSATSVGTCTASGTKAADANYKAAISTATTVNFIVAVPRAIKVIGVVTVGRVSNVMRREITSTDNRPSFPMKRD